MNWRETGHLISELISAIIYKSIIIPFRKTPLRVWTFLLVAIRHIAYPATSIWQLLALEHTHIQYQIGAHTSSLIHHWDQLWNLSIFVIVTNMILFGFGRLLPHKGHPGFSHHYRESTNHSFTKNCWELQVSLTIFYAGLVQLVWLSSIQVRFLSWLPCILRWHWLADF